MEARDLYLKYTDKNGNETIRELRVYDAERKFFAELMHAVAEGGSCEVSSREAYLVFHKRQKGKR